MKVFIYMDYCKCMYNGYKSALYHIFCIIKRLRLGPSYCTTVNDTEWVYSMQLQPITIISICNKYVNLKNVFVVGDLHSFIINQKY